MTEPTADPRGNRRGDPEVDVALDETTGLETDPAVADLADGDIKAQEITMDAHRADAPRGPRAEDLVWDEKESQALRQARKDTERTASVDSVRTYLRQIGKIALLSAEEEVELGQRIEAGLYAAERVRTAEDSAERLSPQLHRDLGWIVRDGQRAKNHLLEANLRLVVSLAKRYTGRGMPLLDLIQKGNLGLIRAMENSTTPRVISSPPTPPGGSAKPSPAQWPTRPEFVGSIQQIHAT